MTKQILVIALDRRTEALRMAAGLTLLDDPVQVMVCGELDGDAEEHLEALDFAEVPVERVDASTHEGMGRVAAGVINADAVYVI